MARGGPKPVDVLMSDLEFLNEYLVELAAGFRENGQDEDAAIAEGWSALPLEAIDVIGNLNGS